jgi:endonuclease G
MPRRRSDQDDLQPLVDAGVNAFFRLSPPAQAAVAVLLLIAGAIAAYFYLHQQRMGPGGAGSPNLVLGNPSNASADPSVRDNYLMVKPFYVLSYNDTKGTPNWVSWRVTQSDLGEAPRKDEFDPDTTLPTGFQQITQRDYNGSGFDRGHMCPHSDRAANIEMSYSTFVMTNIIPQAPNVNRKAWAQMEDYCRELVRQDHDRLYMIAGPTGQGGTGSRGLRSTIADGRVVVPRSCWKVVVIVPDIGGDDLSQITAGTRVLTVEMPNDENAVDEQWAQYRTTPSQVEQETGLHFFTALSPAVAAALRNHLDQERLPAPRVRGEENRGWRMEDRE